MGKRLFSNVSATEIECGVGPKKQQSMKFAADRPLADPETAIKTLIEIADADLTVISEAMADTVVTR
jgi:hypothetical protein